MSLAALLTLAAATVTVAPTVHSNATTLPFQRHVVRLGPKSAGQGTLVFVVQKHGAEGDGLTLYSSRNSGGDWKRVEEVPVDDDIRYTGELLADPDGRGFLLLAGVEPQSSGFDTRRPYDVVLFHYSMEGSTPVRDAGPIVVFEPRSGQAYFRPSLTRDATGTLHASATLLDGSRYRFVARRSIDEGQEWTEAEQLASSSGSFIGGRLLAFGSRVAALYDEYEWDASGRYRVAPAGPCAEWGDEEIISKDDGLYHAGAFAATATPDGRIHLVYQAKRNGGQRLVHRSFGGFNWSGTTVLEPTGWWANQPAVGRLGNDLVVAWNRPRSSNRMEIVTRTLSNGRWSSERVVDDAPVFKGYTNGQEELVAGEGMLVVWCEDAKGGAVARAREVSP